MNLFVEILFCVFATFGVYAFFARVAVMLLRKEECHLAVKGDGRTREEIAARLSLSLLRLERDKSFSKEAVVLLDEEDAALENALLSEGFLVYKRRR